MTGWLIPVVIVALVALALLFAPTRRILRKALNLIPALALFVIGLAAYVLWKPVNWLIARVAFLASAGDRFAAGVERIGARKTGLPAGDREAVARELWPEDRYPFLYSQVPEDIRRPLWEDGKLVGGQDIPWMADRHFSTGLTKAAGQCGLAAALIALVAQPLLLLAWKGVASQDATAAPVLLEQFPNEAPAYVSGWQVWQAVAADFAASLLGGAMTMLGLLAAWLLIAVGVGILVAVAAIEHWRREASAPYEVISKDAHVRWPYRAEAREIARTGYARQVAHATGYLADSPLFQVGSGTGTFRVRGDLAAPSKGQALALDGESLFQHMLVFGGTGDGKTTAVLKPLLRQVFAQPDFGAYITDAKGVLWHDAEKIAAAAGRSGDVLRIGTGTGELGVNITASLAPNHIAAVLRSVLTQVGGAQGDSFWPDMAANVMRHALTVGRAYAATPEGEAEAKRPHPSSLWWAYQAVLDEKKLQAACDAISRANIACLEGMKEASAAGDQDAYMRHVDRIRVLAASDVAASLSYVTATWKDMAKDTKTGITANISQLMDGFAGARELRERFLCGLDEDTANLDAPLNGKIALVTLNTMEDGLPARLVAILLKTVLYREARRREAALKKQGGNPQAKPCLVMMDEVQELATVDPASGLSDATFWNVARSTGIAGVFATQTVAALTQAMGKDAADNFMQQARSKIFLRSEDQATVSYACWLAGEFERNRVFGDGQWESLDQRELISGWSPFAPLDDDAPPPDADGAGFYFAAARGFLNSAAIGAATAKPTYAPDMRFVPDATDQATQLAALSAQQQAAWRQEDRDRQYRAEGNAMTPAMTPADFIAMGRWHAYAHIQRAGIARQDVVALTHEF
ncbi:TraM recognition site of TraD and TraG [Sphingomonas laterariae]|uniref:TraM recognition site of TraD and TraG n=1 Tax=Edaphosphingomonas laterariae TaxID=861865 RepID=A0A239DK63_9SPHN|nr:type IV secretion system DNA-binding domain-containing protein [Sphingomonas laterariae]SNS32272.1 TraM recognition site of TraD and TraG [Sphingomonas laterariae]